MSSDQKKKKDILSRIEFIKRDLAKANEFLESGANSEWHGFRAVHKRKIVLGKVAPPHREWVINVFVPSRERALKKAEKLLERFE